MDLVQPERFSEALAALPPAPDTRERSFGDDLEQFRQDLGRPGLGNTGRAFRAAARSALENDLSFGVSDDLVMAQQYAPIVEALNKGRGPLDPQLVFNPYLGSSYNPFTFADRLARGQPVTRDGQEDMIWQRMGELRKADPGAAGKLPVSKDELIANVRAEQRAAHDYSQMLAQGGGTLTGTIPNFAGSIVGGAPDPVNIAATMAGFPAAESLLKTALIEGGLNAGVTAVTMPSRAAHYADIGEPLTAGDMASEVAGSAVLGAGVGVGGKLLARVLGLRGHDLVKEFNARNPDAAPSFRTAANMVEDRANLEATNPFDGTPQGVDLHRQAMIATQAALDDGRPDMLPDFSAQVEASARRDAPDAFAEYEAALGERDQLRRQLEEAAGTREGSAAAAAARDRIEAILGKVGGVEDKLTNVARDRLRQARADLDAALTADTPDMAVIRERLLAADYRARDAGPAVAAAMRDARVALDADGNLHPAREFTTAKGSTYRVHSDGTTTRTKAPRPEHPGESGPQPRSEATFYATPEQADALSLFQTQGAGALAIEPLRNGRWGVRYLEGEHAGRVERRTVVVPARAPAAGLLPVEIFDGGRTVHFGNPITDVRDPAAPAIVAASAGEHVPRQDPESLKPFADPVRHPAAFREQADALARELAPPPERPVGTQGESPAAADEFAGRRGGAAEEGASGAPEASGGQPEFGPAQAQVEALRRLPGDALFADPVTGQEATVGAVRQEIERQSRATERLRGCVGEDG